MGERGWATPFQVICASPSAAALIPWINYREEVKGKNYADISRLDSSFAPGMKSTMIKVSLVRGYSSA